MSRTERTVFHASPYHFDWPDYERLLANRQGHDNGALGLWCALDPSWIGGFGEHLYAVTYTGTALRMTISAFSRLCAGGDGLHSDAAVESYYHTQRDRWCADGYDVLEIVETSGRVDMLIILNLEAITAFRLHNRPTKEALSHGAQLDP